MILEELLNLHFVPNILLQLWRSLNQVSIVIDLRGKLQEASTVGEEGGNSVSNVTAVVVSSSEGEVVGHLGDAAAGEGQHFQLISDFEWWTPRWNNDKKIILFYFYF